MTGNRLNSLSSFLTGHLFVVDSAFVWYNVDVISAATAEERRD